MFPKKQVMLQGYRVVQLTMRTTFPFVPAEDMDLLQKRQTIFTMNLPEKMQKLSEEIMQRMAQTGW